MYYMIYKKFFEFPILILSNTNPKDMEFWSDWNDETEYLSSSDSVLIGINGASNGDEEDDPVISFVSSTIDLGNKSKKKFIPDKDNKIIFKGKIYLCNDKKIEVNQEPIFVNSKEVILTVWGNKDK